MGVIQNATTALSMGCAYVETKVETKIIRQGQEINGVVCLSGGKNPVNIKSIDVEYYTIYTKANKATKLVETKCATAFTLAPNSKEEVHFSLRISPDVPITKLAYLKTIFDVNPSPKAIKTSLRVCPSKDLEKIISLLTTKFSYADPTTQTYLSGGQLHQRFVFKSKNLFGRFIDELDCYFLHVTGGIEMVMKIDKRARSFKTVLANVSDNKSYFNVFIPPYDVSQTLERYLVKGR